MCGVRGEEEVVLGSRDTAMIKTGKSIHSWSFCSSVCGVSWAKAEVFSTLPMPRSQEISGHPPGTWFMPDYLTSFFKQPQ